MNQSTTKFGKALNPPETTAESVEAKTTNSTDNKSQILFRHVTAQRFKMGRFQFEKFLLRVDAGSDDEAEFRDLLAKQPPYISAEIQELTQEALINMAMGEAAKRVGIDTTSGSYSDSSTNTI